jgi:hypothetical protein
MSTTLSVFFSMTLVGPNVRMVVAENKLMVTQLPERLVCLELHRLPSRQWLTANGYQSNEIKRSFNGSDNPCTRGDKAINLLPFFSSFPL